MFAAIPLYIKRAIFNIWLKKRYLVNDHTTMRIHTSVYTIYVRIHTYKRVHQYTCICANVHIPNLEWTEFFSVWNQWCFYICYPFFLSITKDKWTYVHIRTHIRTTCACMHNVQCARIYVQHARIRTTCACVHIRTTPAHITTCVHICTTCARTPTTCAHVQHAHTYNMCRQTHNVRAHTHTVRTYTLCAHTYNVRVCAYMHNVQMCPHTHNVRVCAHTHNVHAHIVKP